MADLLCGWCLSLSATMSRLQATTSLLSMSPARLHTTLSPPVVPVIPVKAHIKRGNVAPMQLPCQPCAAECNGRLALWLMLVPVSYHEPFAGNHQFTQYDPARLHTTLSPPVVPVIPVKAHIKRGNVAPMQLPCQPCAAECNGRLALWLMLVPVSYHEPFAGNHQFTQYESCQIAHDPQSSGGSSDSSEGTYKARQRCPYAIALPTLCRRVQWQTCFVADACPCQLPWAACRQPPVYSVWSCQIAHDPQSSGGSSEGAYKARQRCPYAIALPTLCRRVQWQTCFVADACPCQLPWAVCRQRLLVV